MDIFPTQKINFEKYSMIFVYIFAWK